MWSFKSKEVYPLGRNSLFRLYEKLRFWPDGGAGGKLMKPFDSRNGSSSLI